MGSVGHTHTYTHTHTHTHGGEGDMRGVGDVEKGENDVNTHV